MAPNPIPLSPRRLAASGLRLHPTESAFREGSATIVLPSSSAAFLNPVQEFNRDLSVLAIRTWSEMMDEGLKKKWEGKMQRTKEKALQVNGVNVAEPGTSHKRPHSGTSEGENLSNGTSNQGDAKKVRTGESDLDGMSSRTEESPSKFPSFDTVLSDLGHATAQVAAASDVNGEAAAQLSGDGEDVVGQQSVGSSHASMRGYRPYKFTLLEALSATGLRSIRYAREIPLVKQVIANDLSASAVKAMQRNIALNFPAHRPLEVWVPKEEEDEDEDAKRVVQEADLDEDALMNAAGDAGEEPVQDKRATAKQEQGEGHGAATAATAATVAANAGTTTEAPRAAFVDAEAAAAEAAIHPQCRVKPNAGDAMDVMYSHRHPGSRYDVIDLDPYGTAAPFIDGAVQAVADGGLLCVTCTDTAVTASSNYPEKAFSLYGGSCVRSEYSHEIALRLVLHSISAAAAKYGRYIQPLLSLSIDFYVRLFIKVQTGPIEVKKLASKTGITYICSYCGNHHEQRLGRATEQEGRGKKSQTFTKFQNGAGPPTPGEGNKCEECGSQYLVAGPMWQAPIHDHDFCSRILSNVNAAPERSNTAARIRGMVSLAASELPTSPFYFTPAKVAGAMHSTSPPILNVASGLLNAGFSVTRSHCVAGSLKTDASRGQVFDLIRSWIANGHPVKMEGIAEKSPARTLVGKERRKTFDLDTIHPDARKLVSRSAVESNGERAVRYQQNPLPNWGPGTAARRT